MNIRAISIFLFVFVVTIPDVWAQSDPVPTLLPGQFQIGLRFENGELISVPVVAVNEFETWSNPLALYFLNPVYSEKVELTSDQREALDKVIVQHNRHLATLAKNAQVFLAASMRADGSIDFEGYKEKMKANRQLNLKNHREITVALDKIILPHQWKYMAELIAKQTIRSEGAINHLSNPALAKYLKVSKNQRDEIAHETAKIVAEHDAEFAKMSADAINRLLAKLKPSQREKLAKLIGKDDLSSLKNANVFLLTEQLRRFSKQKERVDREK